MTSVSLTISNSMVICEEHEIDPDDCMHVCCLPLHYFWLMDYMKRNGRSLNMLSLITLLLLGKNSVLSNVVLYIIDFCFIHYLWKQCLKSVSFIECVLFLGAYIVCDNLWSVWLWTRTQASKYLFNDPAVTLSKFRHKY